MRRWRRASVPCSAAASPYSCRRERQPRLEVRRPRRRRCRCRSRARADIEGRTEDGQAQPAARPPCPSRYRRSGRTATGDRFRAHPPPRVVRRRGHVVRHDVQQDPHVVALHLTGQRAQRVRAARSLPDARRVRDIVAVRTAGLRASKMGDRYRSLMPSRTRYGTMSPRRVSVNSSLICRRYVAHGNASQGTVTDSSVPRSMNRAPSARHFIAALEPLADRGYTVLSRS
jgi:hypothetical protein